jgi:hypothetical protein
MNRENCNVLSGFKASLTGFERTGNLILKTPSPVRELLDAASIDADELSSRCNWIVKHMVLLDADRL